MSARPNPQPPTPSPLSSASRRGVLLLVVLSLLVLFTLIGVTFVLVASQSRRATRADSRHEQYGDDPQRVLDAVFGQIVRDTTNPRSSLQGHSLLADMYGNDGAKGTMTSAIATAGTSGQMFDITATVTPVSAYPTLTQIQTPGYYNGCVLTMVDGPAARLSARIVGWGYFAPNFTIRVMAFEWPNSQAATDFVGPLGTNRTLVINGRPFNGTGFGYNPAAAAGEDTLLNLTTTIGVNNSIPIPPDVTQPFFIAHLPNRVFFNATPPGFNPTGPTFPYATTLPPNSSAFGGADEDYDARDPQNLLLAEMPITPVAVPIGTQSHIVPSLHHPDTILYVNAAALAFPSSTADGVAARKHVMRQSMLRPFGPMLFNGAPLPYPSAQADHPNFTGSNPDFDAVRGPWDVDNDGDGIADSVWIDVGLPVQTAPDGRRFKPLAAILCLDLDGRINVNAHGNIAHLDTNPVYTTPVGTATGHHFAGTPATLSLPRGQGYGPPEINLSPTVGLAPFDPTTAGKLIATRYQEPNSSLSIAAPAYNTATIPPVHPFPGITSYDDPLSAIKQFDLQLPPTGPTPYKPILYGSPMDLLGRGFTALDVRGMPLTPHMGNPNDRYDDPYELNLSRNRVRAAISPNTPTTPPVTPAATLNTIDRPFTAAELERVLRGFDIDASMLPSRLHVLLFANTTLNLQQLRNAVTTDSVDLSAPYPVPTRDMRANVAPLAPAVSLHIVDLLRERLIQGGTVSVDLELRKMLPPELVAGQRMDINRPFGNGVDDNSNGVVDEPGETETQTWDTINTTAPTQFNLVAPQLSNGTDVNQDGSIDGTDSALTRALYARHLYVLMMLLKDSTVDIDFDGDPANNTPNETAQGIAQWAINVVDFRDRDSIMTPFEYDLNPFNGWSVDGVVGSGSLDDDNVLTHPERRLVWGCERPEVLISETMAFHDRRTEDLADDDAALPNHVLGDPTNPDPTFDQRLPPRGSLFFELYNPWTTQQSDVDPSGRPSATEAPGEFFNLDSSATNVAVGVGLDRLNAGNSPVWRLLIVRGTAVLPVTGLPKDPNDPNVPDRPTPADIERSIYFTQPPATITDHGQAYFCSSPPAPLFPGRYAVVGSAGIYDGVSGTYTTTVGRLLNTSNAPNSAHDGINGQTSQTRRIVLTPSINPLAPNQVQLLSNRPTADPVSPNIQNPIAIAIDRALDAGVPATRSVSISEPVTGYLPAAATPSGGSPSERLYGNPIDTPLDDTSNPVAPANSGSFRYLHLQRLANPLLAWNPEPGAGHDPTRPTNPYLTIDSAPVPLVVFNGVADKLEPGHPNPLGLATAQRGTTQGPGQYFWHVEIPAASTSAAAGGFPAVHNFDYLLNHTLGYLNTPFGDASVSTAYVNLDAPIPAYAGAPKGIPLPWLTWNNRPFAGPMELLFVPRSRSSRLLFNYNPVPSSYYASSIPPSTTGHLLDFFQSATGTAAAHFYRVLDYVQVPSRFVGIETELSPSALPTSLATSQGLVSLFYPPNNKVSNYRDPGRVNINTIPSMNISNTTSPIWDAIRNDPTGTSTPNWPTVIASRQGGATFGAFSTMNANPFRSAGGAALTLPGTPNLPRDGVDVTFLRPQDPLTSNPATDTPLFLYNSASAHDNTNANPAFRYQSLQRLSNLLTTRSNVYAVWVTVGFFEVSPVPVSPIYPDGFMLGQEIGSETGEIKRPRAFYIYDRSIPVGFEPGKDHNIEQGTLTKRFIE